MRKTILFFLLLALVLLCIYLPFPGNHTLLQIIAGEFALRLGLTAQTEIPWIDFIGLFLLIGGIAIGLGATTVIDTVSALGRKSNYWTEVAIKINPITKALNWFGLLVAIFGGLIFFRETGLKGTIYFQALLIVPIVLNSLYQSLRIGPALEKIENGHNKKHLIPAGLQTRIITSLVIAVLCWWSEVFFLAWYLLMQK